MVESIVESSTETVLNVAKAEAIRILHVDDDQAFLKVAKQCLDMQGEFEVDTASSVKEALRKLEKTDYDAVVSDYQMPGKDGLEFLKELREKGNTVPFIVFTGKGREEIAIKALNLGADGYFNKSGHPETVYGELAHGTRQVVGKRRAEQSFLKSEDKYRRLVETLHEGIWIIDKDSCTTFVNPRMAEMLGYDTEEMKGKPLFSFMDERGVEIAERLLERRRQGIREQHDFEFLRKDGTRVYATLETSPLTDDNGKYVGALASVMDTTERKRAEQALRESEERLRSVVENSSDQIFMLDRDCKFLSINKTAADLSRMSPQEMIGMSIIEIFPETIAAKFSGNIKTVFDTGKSLFLDETMVVKGRELYNSTSLNPVRDDSGRVTAVTGIVRDITERKKAEEELRIQREELQVILDSMPAKIWYKDRNNRLVRVNKTFAEYMGASKENLEGKPLCDLFPPDIAQKCWAEDKEVITTGQPKADILDRYESAQGVRWFSTGKIPYREKDGNIIGTINFSVDITELKKAEEEIKSLARFPSENPNPVLRISQDCRILFANDAGKALLKKLNCEVGGSVQTFLKSLTVETLKSKSHKNEESEIGGRIYRFYAMPIVDREYVNVYGIDITERKKAEEEVRKNRRLLVETGKMAKVGGWELDLSTNEVSWTEEIGRIHGVELGYKPTLKEAIEFYAPESIPVLEATLKKTMETGEPYDLESLFIPRCSKDKIWVRSLGKAIYDGNKIVKLAGTFQDIDKYKKTEEALRQSEEGYRELAESIDDVFFAMDKDFRYTYWNKASEKLTGVSAKDAIGKSLTEVFPDVEGTRVEQFYKEALRTQQPQSYLNKYPLEGKDYVFEINAYPTKSGLSVFVKDITERKKTEEMLRESEEKLRNVFAASPDAITVSDLNGNIVECNQATVALHGCASKEELIGKNSLELIAKKDHKRAIENMKKTLEHGSTKNVEYTFVAKDGREFPAELSASVVTDASGKPEYYMAITKDITERKKAEEELKSSEQKFRGLVEDSAAAIATIDLKGRLTYVNKALADSLGYSVQELSGRAFKDFVHPDDRGNLVRLFLKIIVLRRQPRKFEFRALRKDGAILHLNCRPTRLETAGKTRGFQAIIMDSTAEKHMLEKVEKINEKLSVVGGLTRHDVNNKLSTILNVSYLLKQKLQDNQCLELVKATESAVHQVEGLFEFARTYEKLGTEELAYVDAEKVFSEAARLFPSLKDIRIVNDCHGLTVFADSLLRQLFYNLIDNSLKHGEKVGQVRVHYQTDEDRLKLIYEDDGIGIPKAEKYKIFKEGYGKNSGHGLYMIKRICEVYGWTIQETGRQGKGAQFTINMPTAKPDGRPNGKLG